MRPRAKFDIFLTVLHPVGDRHKGWNAEIGGDVEHPKPASSVRKLISQIADIGIIELAEVDLRPLQAIVPPDRVSIPLYQLKETLDDCLLQRIAGGAAVGICQESGGALVKEI